MSEEVKKINSSLAALAPFVASASILAWVFYSLGQPPVKEMVFTGLILAIANTVVLLLLVREETNSGGTTHEH